MSLLCPWCHECWVWANLKAAAQELNFALDFRPIKDKTRMHLRFITPQEHAARPKRGGRPRKQRTIEVAAGDEASPPPPAVVPSEAAVEQAASPPTQKRRERRPAPGVPPHAEVVAPEK